MHTLVLRNESGDEIGRVHHNQDWSGFAEVHYIVHNRLLPALPDQFVDNATTIPGKVLVAFARALLGNVEFIREVEVNKSEALKYLKQAMESVRDEVLDAHRKYPESFASPHEAYAIILEEVEELWREIQAAQKPRCFGTPREAQDALDKVRAEAVQVAAMAIRTIVDVDTGAFNRRKV